MSEEAKGVDLHRETLEMLWKTDNGKWVPRRVMGSIEYHLSEQTFADELIGYSWSHRGTGGTPSDLDHAHLAIESAAQDFVDSRGRHRECVVIGNAKSYAIIPNDIESNTIHQGYPTKIAALHAFVKQHAEAKVVKHAGGGGAGASVTHRVGLGEAVPVSAPGGASQVPIMDELAQMAKNRDAYIVGMMGRLRALEGELQELRKQVGPR